MTDFSTENLLSTRFQDTDITAQRYAQLSLAYQKVADLWREASMAHARGDVQGCDKFRSQAIQALAYATTISGRS
jgi:hypothetical protein